MGDFLKRFYEGLSGDSLAPVLFSRPIGNLKFYFLGVARNMTGYLLSSKNRLIYDSRRIHDSFPMSVKGRSVVWGDPSVGVNAIVLIQESAFRCPYIR